MSASDDKYVLPSAKPSKTESGLLMAHPQKTLMEEIREEAAARIVKQGNCKGVQGFMDRLIEESLVVWLEYFPRICQEVRRINYEKRKLMREISNKGKFTDSYGWSDSGETKWEYEWTPEFYFFFTNYVYRQFFDEENKKVYNKFMKRLMRGDDAIELLMSVKKVYGSNKQDEMVVN